ncbi:MAG: DUF2970 domain-containing protein [Spongiibacteraceae bacterium]|jgi:hypothetical protein|nr:DUF2970 domain-containing protein [Spongiibacteraceae bacterium]
MSQKDIEKEAPVSFLQMVGSILSSFFGVQSSEKRKRDFSKGRARHFIMVGILMTVVWYVTIALIVKLVVPN